MAKRQLTCPLQSLSTTIGLDGIYWYHWQWLKEDLTQVGSSKIQRAFQLRGASFTTLRARGQHVPHSRFGRTFQNCEINSCNSRSKQVFHSFPMFSCHLQPLSSHQFLTKRRPSTPRKSIQRRQVWGRQGLETDWTGTKNGRNMTRTKEIFFLI